VAVGGLVLLVVIILLVALGGGGPSHSASTTSTTLASAARTPLSPQWRGSGKPVTLAFGGDIHFEGILGERLTSDPATALDGSVAHLVSGSQIAMANLLTALTAGSCPEPAQINGQPKPFIWYAPPTALTALSNADLSLVTEANSHGMDCGQQGLQQAIAAANQAHFTIVGIGNNAAQAYAPYRATINGQRVAVIAATQVFDPGLQSAWTATSSQPGLASAVDEAALVSAVQAARRSADTVVVYVNWGTETQTCPNAQQPPLAQALVKAGADIVVGSSAHVQQGTGYLGQALVDYGLGNLAFYDSAPPETTSGTLLVTVTGRHIDSFSWRPAVISAGLPQPLSGAQAANAIAHWDSLRGCTTLSASPHKSTATTATESPTNSNGVSHQTGRAGSGSTTTTTTGHLTTTS